MLTDYEDIERDVLLNELKRPQRGWSGPDGKPLPWTTDANGSRVQVGEMHGAGAYLPSEDNTGVAGGADRTVGSSSSSGALGSFGHKLEGFDHQKLFGGHDSPKYQFARVASKYDPKDGVTQAMLDELNALGLGTFTGRIGGDKVSIGGQVDPRFEGITEFDVIRDLDSGGGWQWNDASGGGGRGGGSSAARRRGSSEFGSSFGTIENLMPTDTEFYNTLQARLQEILGGPKATGREALLRLLGAR